MYIDSHCHINFPELAIKLPKIFNNMAENNVTHALCASITLSDFPQVLTLAENYSNIYASIGVHPNYVNTPKLSEAQLISLANNPRVIAIGETGLDYCNLSNNFMWQRECFRVHISVSRITRKPLIIHMRSASEDTLCILKEEGAALNKGGVAGVIHCFTESQVIANAVLEMGFYISFSGIITFKNSTTLQSIARQIPLERMLIETDSPYLAPVPFRGKTNEPSMVRYIAEFIANLRNIPVAEVARHTTNNFFDLFKIAR